MRVMVTAFPGEGHVQPTLPFARAAVRDGHDVAALDRLCERWGLAEPLGGLLSATRRRSVRSRTSCSCRVAGGQFDNAEPRRRRCRDQSNRCSNEW